MSCLIYASNSSGCTGKCDANCYNATGPECDCICGGMNHGVGLKKAEQNTRDYADKLIDERQFTINKKIFQLSIFD